jgi:rubrerythrin
LNTEILYTRNKKYGLNQFRSLISHENIGGLQLEDVFSIFDEYFQSKELNIVRGLTIAMELEIKSRTYYQTKSNEIENQTGKALLLFLANEELSHMKIVERAINNLKANNKWIDIKMIKPSELAKPRLFEGKQTEPRIKASSSDNDILLAAMTAERKSEEYYNKMSERIKDSKGKTFFKTLAEFEKVHYNTIRELIK